ncbi:unnamed protein product, partial [Didymodactylos carnosus]
IILKMPIIIRDINWEETDTNLVLHIPMKGAKANKLDVLCSNKYIKISFLPFMFECYLLHLIDDDQSKTIVKDGFIELTLTKQTPERWNKLSHADSDNKEIMKTIREDAVVYISEKEKQRSEKKSSLITSNKRESVREQIKTDNDDRERIESIKNNERMKANEEIKHFEIIQQQKNNLSIQNPDIVKEERSLVKKEVTPRNEKDIFQNGDVRSVETKSDESVDTTPLRDRGRIAVNFTPRVFPTPMRESQSNLEQDWLRKQIESRHKTDDDFQTDLSDKEKDIDYLKSKAKYALELLNPPVLDNLHSRLKAHIRRGAAFCEMELYPQGLLDYEAALKLEPDSEQIKEDVKRIRNFLEKNITS